MTSEIKLTDEQVKLLGTAIGQAVAKRFADMFWDEMQEAKRNESYHGPAIVGKSSNNMGWILDRIGKAIGNGMKV